jgi:ParB-like nuclease domain
MARTNVAHAAQPAQRPVEPPAPLWPASHIEQRALAALVPYARNARAHSDAQIAQIAASMREWGWTSPILVDETDRIIAGHGRVMAGLKLGLTDVPVIVARGWSESKIRAYIIADNRLAENASWDEDMLRLELADLRIEGFDLGLMGFDAGDLASLFDTSDGSGTENEYSRKIETPVYSPKGDRPALADLSDTGKTLALVASISASSVSDDEKLFLISAAARHTVFDYRRIAEYYCHANEEMQTLMEASALVIIDFDKAIEGGFVEMTEQLADLCPEPGSGEDDDE